MNKHIAYLSLRLILGLNVGMHGLTRIIAGTSQFADTLLHQFASTPLPAWTVHLFALCLPWAEALVGLLVLIGVATRVALIVGVLEIVALTLGTTLQQDWPAAAIQLFYVFVYAILLAFLEYNSLSLDTIRLQNTSMPTP